MSNNKGVIASPPMGKGHEGFDYVRNKLLKDAGSIPAPDPNPIRMKVQRGPTTKDLPTSYKGTTATG